MLDFESAFAELNTLGLSSWSQQLRNQLTLQDPPHGHWARWQAAWDQLPRVNPLQIALENTSPAVDFLYDLPEAERSQSKSALLEFNPWRKGPFKLFGVDIDSEWRSDLKWDRVAPHVDLQEKTVLDVGCGNGYYGWRMLGHGARCVIGLEPHVPYVVQHKVIKRYAPALPNHVILAGDQQITQLDFFDVAFSMGVLHHSSEPQEHLNYLRNAIHSNGSIVLETLILPNAVDTVLTPKRYAKMPNVRYLPSLDRLTAIVVNAGFHDVEVVDVTATTVNEQRATEWMTFESLCDFLSTNDNTQTVEGLPAPTRAVLVATRN